MWSYAELAFQQTSDLGYPFPEALAYTGFVREQQGKDGERWLNEAMQLAPVNPQVLYLQGIHLRNTNRFDDSLDTFLLANGLSVNNPAIMAEVGTAYELLGNFDLAQIWFTRAIDTADDPTVFQPLLENVLTQQELLQAEIEEFLQIPPTPVSDKFEQPIGRNN
jgi:Flp pilus assembly protein TadD